MSIFVQFIVEIASFFLNSCKRSYGTWLLHSTEYRMFSRPPCIFHLSVASRSLGAKQHTRQYDGCTIDSDSCTVAILLINQIVEVFTNISKDKIVSTYI